MKILPLIYKPNSNLYDEVSLNFQSHLQKKNLIFICKHLDIEN